MYDCATYHSKLSPSMQTLMVFVQGGMYPQGMSLLKVYRIGVTFIFRYLPAYSVFHLRRAQYVKVVSLNIK